MKNMIHAEFYKLIREKPIWFVPVVYVALGFYACYFDHEIFDLYRGLDFFSLSECIRIYLPFTAAVATGYIIGGDFSRRTIQNALSVGVDKKHYYFSRLLAQMLLTTGLYAITVLIHITGHFIHPMGNAASSISFLWLKLSVYMLIILLQLLAYVSVMNAVCYFVKNRLAAIAVGMGVVYAEIIIHQVSSAREVELLKKIANYAPSNVFKNMFTYAVYDQVFTFEFLQFGISAVILIIMGCVAGFMKFYYDMDIR